MHVSRHFFFSDSLCSVERTEAWGEQMVMVGVDAKTERKVCLRVTHEVERQQRELELRRELGACPFLVEVTPATVDAQRTPAEGPARCT